MTSQRAHLSVVGDTPPPSVNLAETPPDEWEPPTTYREGLEHLTALAAILYDRVQDELLIPSTDVEFLVLRMRRLALDLHHALPRRFE